MKVQRMLSGLILLSAFVPAAVAAAQNVQLPGRETPLSWSFSERKRIGRADGAEWETFHQLRSPAFRRNGDVYVLDQGNSRVHVFDSTGAHLRSFGKLGRGPGEFAQPGWIVVTAGDTIAVLDYAARGFHLFSPGGEFLRTHRLPEEFAGIADPVHAHPGGGVVFTHQPRDTQDARVIWYRFDGSISTLATIPRPRETMEIPSAGGVTNLVVPPAELAPPLLFAPLADGSVAYTLDAPYRLQLRAGTRTTMVTRAGAPREVTDADREQARKAKRAELEGYSGGSMVISGGRQTQRAGGLPAMVIDQIIAQMRFAPVVPEIRDLRVDGAGRLWVLRSTPSAFGPSAIDVLRPDGAYVGTIASAELPNAFGPGGLVAFIRTDDEGVQQLSIGRIG